MVIVDEAFNQIAVTMGGGAGVLPTHIAIGTGSTTVGSTQVALNTETDRNGVSLVDTSVDAEVTYIGDFSSTEISGTTLWEFGLFNTGSGAVMYQREVIGSVEFSGDRELQIQMTHKYLRP